MQEDDRIKDCQWDWEEDGCFLEYDISYLHPDLGILSQSYRSDSYDGRRVYQSDFVLFGKDAEKPKDFSYLSEEVKAHLWNIIFAFKRKFLMTIPEKHGTA